MVEESMPANVRISIGGSTLVEAAMYDEAAERIHIWDRSGRHWMFDGCDWDLWRLFMVPHESRGAFVVNVLNRHPHRLIRN
jgi:hypothetical protein